MVKVKRMQKKTAPRMLDGTMLVVLLISQKDYEPFSTGHYLLSGFGLGGSLSRKHLTYALLSCYNNTLRGVSWAATSKMELRGTQEVHYNNPRFFGTAKDLVELALDMI